MHLNKGFTLIEIMVAMFVLTVGMLGVLALFLAGSAMGQDAVDMTEAATLLDSLLSDIAANYQVKYALPSGYTRGYPKAYLDANNGKVPENPFAARIPEGWAGTAGDANHPGFSNSTNRNQTGLLRNGVTYVIYYVPLPNTRHFYTNEIQCVLAEVTIYWLRQGQVFELDGEQVVYIGNQF